MSFLYLAAICSLGVVFYSIKIFMKSQILLNLFIFDMRNENKTKNKWTKTDKSKECGVHSVKLLYVGLFINELWVAGYVYYYVYE